VATIDLVSRWLHGSSRFPGRRCLAVFVGCGMVELGGFKPCKDGDMACNVWEWCSDWYQGYPGTSSRHDEFGETNRVVRGGSWGCPRLRARCASRSGNVPDLRLNSRGFRCCLSPTSSL
jgi:hypothetical protein